jgi:beta-carotene hydroxylase
MRHAVTPRGHAAGSVEYEDLASSSRRDAGMMSERGLGKIPVDRAWLGAPEGTWINPTVWLLVGSLGALALGSFAYATGLLPPSAVIVLHAAALYVIFTPLHESMHGVAHRNVAVNEWIGRIAGALLTTTLPLFRAVHYEHHSHTNDPRRDPDFVVALKPRWLLPLWCVAVMAKYRVHFYGRGLARSGCDWWESVAYDVAQVGLLITATVTGTLSTLWTLWIAPVLLATSFLAFAFDFLPHYPYDTDTRYYDTRIYGGEMLNAVLLGQNQHLIHHLWTTIPWFRYRPVLSQIYDQLVARGCRIGWRVAPLPPSLQRHLELS